MQLGESRRCPSQPILCRADRNALRRYDLHRPLSANRFERRPSNQVPHWRRQSRRERLLARHWARIAWMMLDTPGTSPCHINAERMHGGNFAAARDVHSIISPCEFGLVDVADRSDTRGGENRIEFSVAPTARVMSVIASTCARKSTSNRSNLLRAGGRKAWG